MIKMFSAKKLPQDVNSKGVFACNELDLEEVQVYGFDYDYTLACYKPSMDHLLYNLGRDVLIKKHKVILKNNKKIHYFLWNSFGDDKFRKLCN